MPGDPSRQSPIQRHKQRGSSCLVYVFREKLFRALHSLTRVFACARKDTHRSSSTKLKSASVLALLQIHFNLKKCKPEEGKQYESLRVPREKKCENVPGF